jgi:hypothetical protein
MVLTESGYLLASCSVLAVFMFGWLSYSSFLSTRRQK